MTNAEKAICELILSGYLKPGQVEIKLGERYERFIILNNDKKKIIKFKISSGKKEIKRGIKKIVGAETLKEQGNRQGRLVLG